MTIIEESSETLEKYLRKEKFSTEEYDLVNGLYSKFHDYVLLDAKEDTKPRLQLLLKETIETLNAIRIIKSNKKLCQFIEDKIQVPVSDRIAEFISSNSGSLR